MSIFAPGSVAYKKRFIKYYELRNLRGSYQKHKQQNYMNIKSKNISKLQINVHCVMID